MFPEIKRYIETEVEPVAEATSEFLHKLNGARRRNLNSIAKSEEQIKLMKNEVKYVASIKPEINNNAKKIAKDTLFNAALVALRTNKEFDDPLYRVPLFESIESDDTYLVRITGAGFNSKVSVDINLDKSAGRLNMWADAIKSVRKSLGIKIPRKDSKNYYKSAKSASHAWARHYTNKDDIYTSTIESRLEISAKPAPFWSILNFGTVALASDRGGFPTPKNKATNFVDKAEKDVALAIRGLFDTARENFNQSFADYNTYLDEALSRQERLDSLRNEIKLELSSIRKLESTLNLEGQEINRNKLQAAVMDVKNNLSNKKTFEIGVKGSRKRISRSTIKEFYG
jgi:hypothetical protein